MADYDELKERLCAAHLEYNEGQPCGLGPPINPDGPDAAEAITALQARNARLEAALRSAIENCDNCGGTGVRYLYSVDPENGTSREIRVKCHECSAFRAVLSDETPDTPQDTRICKICDGGPGNNGVCTCGMKAWDTEDKGDGK